MSSQYQLFKQDFFNKHPLSNKQQKSTEQSHNQSFKTYDPYGLFAQDNEHLQSNHKNNDYKLKIQNETHFPFDQSEQPTFNQFQINQLQTARLNLNYNVSKQKQFLNNQQQYPAKSQFQSSFRTKSKNEFQDLQKPSEQQELNKINNELNKLRISRQQESFYKSKNEFQERLLKNDKMQLGFHRPLEPQNSEFNKQYTFKVSPCANNQIYISPKKQSPVIYNTVNSHIKNPQKTISPIITQDSKIVQHHYLSSHPNPSIISSTHNPVQLSYMTTIQSSNQNQNIYSGIRLVGQPEIRQNQINSNISQPVLYQVGSPSQQIVNQQLIQNFEKPKSTPLESFVSKIQYENLKAQCTMWQKKYYQSKDELIKFQSQRGNYLNSSGLSSGHDTFALREQNNRLIEKIRDLQNSQKFSNDKIKQSFEQLIQRYKESLTKECNLLLERYKIQMKHNQRF